MSGTIDGRNTVQLVAGCLAALKKKALDAYCREIVSRPKTWATGFFAVLATLSFCSLLYPVHIDTELNSFRARDRPIACQFDALQAARLEATLFPPPHKPVIPKFSSRSYLEAAEARWPVRPAPNATSDLTELPQSHPAFWLTLIYEELGAP